MKRIGILGGISPESTRLYYERIVQAYHARQGDYYYPEIVIFSLNFQRFTDLENRGDTEGYVGEIMAGVEALQRAGVDFALMAANSPHAALDLIAQRATVPLLSIVDVTLDHAQRLGLKRLLLLGIKFTMQASFYPEACARRGIELLVPAEEEQHEIDRIIFQELAVGRVLSASRARLLQIIAGYDVEGAILGCTELPMILRPEDTTLPLLNTLALHAEAALDYALGDLA
ncbi:MAG: amino acid racemase [Chloroflexi bacterium]|nr:MAG: amino acid racemase [Chloroflexota bacterium]